MLASTMEGPSNSQLGFVGNRPLSTKEWLYSLSHKAMAMHLGLEKAEHLEPLLECN